MTQLTDYVNKNSTPIISEELLIDLRDIYNIDGIELMKHYGVSRLRVIKQGSLMDAAIYDDRVTVFVNPHDQIYAIEMG